jgi:Cu/Ag efflux protein CusF
LNEKLVGVPLDALTPVPGAGHLVLDADKSKLTKAQGFAKNNWPDLNAITWDTAAGLGRDENQQPQSITGTIKKVDRANRKITLDQNGEERDFHFDANAPSTQYSELTEGASVKIEYVPKGKEDGLIKSLSTNEVQNAQPNASNSDTNNSANTRTNSSSEDAETEKANEKKD